MATVDFIENKEVQGVELQRILYPSIQKNQHTNFGPVADALCQRLLILNSANPLRGGCCTANATLAIQAVVATMENFLGRRLRWAVSDFGFFTNFIGPFTNRVSVSCLDNGMISVSHLHAIPAAAYDAVLVTNVFGVHEDFTEIFAFCRAHGKILLIDNAAGFGALAPYHAMADENDTLIWAEVVSFHHTKAWGMGEGGAAFLARDLIPTFRAAINFGVGDSHRLADARLCTNGKMSELAAAQILLRVRACDQWIGNYRRQAKRILALGKAVGLLPLVHALPIRAVPANLPFLCRTPIALSDMENPHFTIRKYYRPAKQSGEMARAIFDRVLNVPCHPGMAALSDAAILGVLRGIMERA